MNSINRRITNGGQMGVNGAGNGKLANFLKVLTICVAVISAFAIQAIQADVRNRERDTYQDEKITTTQIDVREIRTKLSYIERAQTTMLQEQKEGFSEIKGLIKEMKT